MLKALAERLVGLAPLKYQRTARQFVKFAITGTIGASVDFGIYINADDIAKRLRKGTFSFKRYKIDATTREFNLIATQSGLLSNQFPVDIFKKSFAI
ncbi:hypothetical protein IH781_03935, partial [Patescibacteria group bacterium]|nr:hypothetical protein [Patescibacteria group bacterium]